MSLTPVQGQLMSSYTPIENGKEFICGPTEDCRRYTEKQRKLCDCVVESKTPYTTTP